MNKVLISPLEIAYLTMWIMNNNSQEWIGNISNSMYRCWASVTRCCNKERGRLLSFTSKV
jgi:hypothetical protein